MRFALSWFRGLCCVGLVALVGCPGPKTEDEPLDTDGDGSPVEEDCDDAGTWYGDADGDGYGDASTTTTACIQPEGTAADAEDCDDSDPRVYPGAAEVCDDGVVNDCDSDEAAAVEECGLEGTVSLANSDLKLVGEAGSDLAGWSVSGVGDVDGDGRDDLLVGALYEDTGGTNAGAAYVVFSSGALASASTLLDLSEADVKLVGEARADYAGWSVSGAGDVDSDGRDDLLVGAPYEDTGGTDAGAAYLLLGGGALASASPLLDLSVADMKIVGEASTDYAGISVSGAGDVDGDGRHDLLVGAIGADTGGSAAGAAYLMLGGGALASGSAPLDLSEADFKLVGEAIGDWAGWSVSRVGDVDGDGRDDLLVGAYSEGTGGYEAGAAYLLLGGGALASGSALLDLSGADVKLVGEGSADYAGTFVSGAGDVDSDGRDDLLVGAPREDTGGTDAGAAYLLLGSGALASAAALLDLSEADMKIVGEASGDNAGMSASGVGDVGGDGHDDVLVGAYYETTGGENAGAAYLMLGGGALAGASGTLSLAIADLKLTGEAGGDLAGASVSGAGDVNGDGSSDLLVGASQEDSGGVSAGAAYLLHGGGSW